LSLWDEFASNDLVILYFFEGSSFFAMDDIRIKALNMTLKENFNLFNLIGVNRKVQGRRCLKFPIIEENMGWDGKLVNTFHNHRKNELVIVDSNARILCRGRPDRKIVETIFTQIKPDKTYSALYTFDHYISKY
jgi:hypothetical protein